MRVGFQFWLVVFCCFVFVLLLRMFDWGHRIQFEDLSGVQASQEMVHWRYQIAAERVQRISVQSEHTMDSFEVWTKVQLSQSDSDVVADGMHSDLLADPSSSDNNDHVEFKMGVLSSLSHEALKGAPTWWDMPKEPLRYTQRMLWRQGTPYARGCYTVFDQQAHILWAYEFSQQHQVFWPRGSGEGSVLEEASAD